jgi:hypothetical protein
LFCMGLLGYFSRSTVSLVLGVAPGLATLLLGTLSLNFWRSGRSSFLFILGQAGEITFHILGVLYVCLFCLTHLLIDMFNLFRFSNFCCPCMEVFSCILTGNYRARSVFMDHSFHNSELIIVLSCRQIEFFLGASTLH